MKYDFSKPEFDDKDNFTYRRFEIVDANGLQWKHVIHCDTETGELTRVIFDARGNAILNEDKTEVVKEYVKTAAPLRITPTPYKSLESPDLDFTEYSFVKYGRDADGQIKVVNDWIV